ncbi:MAG TPA: hypothetical protein VJZ69_00475 [Clostridia bacterium]|nr:hypothetical protein [Clostridia bacterium]
MNKLPKSCKILILCLALLIFLFSFTACANKTDSIVELETVRSFQNSGVDFNYYTFSFIYSKDMAQNYYEVQVQYDKTSYYIQQDYIFFQLAYNVNSTAVKIPDTKALFGIQLPSSIKSFTITLCRCNTKSSSAGFEVLERLYKRTFAF